MTSSKNWETQQREHKRQWDRWNEICPSGFEDVAIKEYMTGKAAPRPEYNKESGNSSLDD